MREAVRQVPVRMSTDLHEALKARAIEEDRSIAAVMRRALKMYLVGDGATFPRRVTGEQT